MTHSLHKQHEPLRLLALKCLGALLMLELCFWLSVGHSLLYLKTEELPMALLSLGGLCFSIVLLDRLNRSLNSRALQYPILFSAILLVLSLAILAYARWYYSRSFLLYFAGFGFVFMYALQLLQQHFNRWRIAIINDGNTYDLTQHTEKIDWVLVNTPADLENEDFTAIVGDLHHENLKDEWVRTLADAALKNIPIHHTATLYESLCGKVLISNSAKLHLEQLKPSKLSMHAKRAFDIFAVFASAPIVVPLVLITALLIRLESSGKAMFTQQRVGQNGKPFTLYKLRSMCSDSEAKGSQFAQKDDVRVTRIGKVIRKMRIDELPQFINILKGEMSLIGPRPEQIRFAKEFEQEIPFYAYRHILKPGITGWAQTTQGYAASSEETQEKLAYDLYYIKRYSLMLDAHIVLKTIWTVCTGFGAR